ncbi:MAG: DUF2817 domain-containing protein [Bdellovibrio sp.]
MFISEIERSFENSIQPWARASTDWVHPEAGPDGRKLRTHYIHLKTDPSRVLISISGTHGPEAFVGSLIQQQILKRFHEIGVKPNGPSVVFVHNLNCFGSAWVRRGNHQNVDLNRNAWNGKRPLNLEFERYAPFLSARSTPEFWSRLAAQLPDISRFGIGPVLEAIARGQATHPNLLFYAGSQRTPELRQLQAWLKSELNPQVLFALDAHTGLGFFKQESLIGEPDLSAQKAQDLESLFKTKLIDTRSPGYYPTTGTLGNLFPETFPTASIGYLTQEFGTRNLLTVMKTLILENARWQNQKSMDPKRIEPMLHAFFPSEPDWQEHVVSRGVQRFLELYDSL